MRIILALLLMISALTSINAQPVYGTPFSIFTRKSTAVEVKALTSGELSPYEKATIESYITTTYTGTYILGEATNSYNCFNFAYNLSDGNPDIVWMNRFNSSAGDNIDNYWNDGSLIQVCNEADADKINYFAGDHSAITSAASGKYDSKWGNGNLVTHTPTNVPLAYSGSNRDYYANTKINGATYYLCDGTRTFSVKSITGATYSWTNSSGLTATSGSTSNTFTVQRNGSSTGTNSVSVAITSPCSSQTVNETVSFPVGGIDAIPGVNTQFIMIHCNVVGYKYTVHSPSATNYKWYQRDYPSGTIWTLVQDSGDTTYAALGGGSTCASYEIRVVASNSCDSTDYYFPSDDCPPFQAEGCTYGRSLLVSPNPVSSNVNLQIIDEVNSSELKRGRQIQRIKVLDKMGQFKKLIQGDNSSKMSINLSELPADIYTVFVYDGKLWLSAKIIKR